MIFPQHDNEETSDYALQRLLNAVLQMITLDGTFSQKLARRLEEEVQNRSTHIIIGTAQTLEDYKARVAEVKALTDVLGWMEEIETAIRKGD